MFKPKKQISIFVSASFDKRINATVRVDEGTILLDAINEAGLKNISVFGVCDKQLSCHSCAVDILNKYDELCKPTDQEVDVLCDIGKRYNERKTRMSCQIPLSKDLDGLVVEIHKNSFINDEESD